MTTDHRDSTDVDDELVRQIMRQAPAAERTVYRRIIGLPVRGHACQRVDAELERLGLLPRPRGER